MRIVFTIVITDKPILPTQYISDSNHPNTFIGTFFINSKNCVFIRFNLSYTQHNFKLQTNGLLLLFFLLDWIFAIFCLLHAFKQVKS